MNSLEQIENLLNYYLEFLVIVGPYEKVSVEKILKLAMA